MQTSTASLHLAPQNLVHMGLIPLATAAKPSQNIGVDTKADELLDRPVKTSDLNSRGRRFFFRRIGKIDFRIGLGSKRL